MINKLLPIIDTNKKAPSFYAVSSLSKKEIEDIIRLYEYFFNSNDIKKIKIIKEEKEQLEN
ncbi:MAG: hypothetical protein JXN63_06375 [Candidatus Delongbacteria bacterium]|nr:hypothetical protein [Candidatus Delongbacteria bacterium]